MENDDKLPAKKQEINSGTIEDLKEGLGILERLAQIFISIFSIFKSKEK